MLAGLLDEPIRGYEREARLSRDDVGIAAGIGAEALVALRWAVLLRDPDLLEPLSKWAEKALCSNAIRDAELAANESVNRQLAAFGVEARIDVEAPERLRTPGEWRAEQIRLVRRLVESTETRTEAFVQKVASVITMNFANFCGLPSGVVPPEVYERVRRKIELTLSRTRHAPENLVDAAMRSLGVPAKEVKNLGMPERMRRWRNEARKRGITPGGK